MAEPVVADFNEPEEYPGFDLDDAAVLVCLFLIFAGYLGVVGVLIRISVGG